MRELLRKRVDVSRAEKDLVALLVDGRLGSPYASAGPGRAGGEGGQVPFQPELARLAGEGEGDKVADEGAAFVAWEAQGRGFLVGAGADEEDAVVEGWGLGDDG